MTEPGWPRLPTRVQEAIRRLRFDHPTPVQSACLPAALRGQSLLAVAPTGSGKTLVYLLPIWKAFPERERNLIVVPTRELAYQVSQMLQAVAPDARDGLALCVGGHELATQVKSLRHGWHTLIATPGRLLDIVERMPELLRSIRLLVLDEFDKLIDLGFEAQIAAILDRLPAHRQTLLFSATGDNAALHRLPIGPLEKHNLVHAKTAALTEQFYFLKSNRKKNELLLKSLGETQGQAIVFVGNREKANHLNGYLRLHDIPSHALHGDRPQRERAQVYQDFHAGRFQVMVATDLAGRGLDIPEVDLIVNFDLPRTFRDYVHRSGRTARRERSGSCLSFVGPDEWIPLRNLEEEFGGPLPCHPDFANRDIWFAQAKRAHASKVRLEKRKQFIRTEQGIDPQPL